MHSLFVGTCFVVGPWILHAAAAQFTVEQLTGAPGGSISYVAGVSGPSVVGASYLGDPQDGNTQPVEFGGPQGGLLPVPQGAHGSASATNGSGGIVGSIWTTDSNVALPAVWEGGQLQTLSTGEAPAGNAYGINSNGVVVGDINNNQPGNPASQAAMWVGGQLTILGNFPGMQAWSPAINNQGQVLVLTSGSGQGATWIWSSGNLAQLPSLGGNDFGGAAINDSGHIVGSASTADGETTAFLWNGSITAPLASPQGWQATYAQAINNSDEIVGSGLDGQLNEHALLWVNGQVFDLNSLIPADSGWTLLSAKGVADNGAIVGAGIFNGQSEAFELTPSAAPSAFVPEPASLAILALGATTLLRRRRRAARA